MNANDGNAANAIVADVVMVTYAFGSSDPPIAFGRRADDASTAVSADARLKLAVPLPDVAAGKPTEPL